MVEQARRAAEEMLETVAALKNAFLREIFALGKNLARGWRWVELGNICRIDRHIAESGSKEAQSLIYYSLEHIESQTGRMCKDDTDDIDGLGSSATFQFDDCHVLYGKLRPYLNKVAVPQSPGRCTVELIPLLPADSVDRYFLAWLLRRPETIDFAMQNRTGSRMPRADMNSLLTLKVPLPPLSEQRRIVALLNRRMALAEELRAAAQARLDAVQALPGTLLRLGLAGEL